MAFYATHQLYNLGLYPAEAAADKQTIGYMITIEIPLVDIIVDLEQDVDLTALSEDEAILHITRVYQFLPLSLNIVLIDGTAIIVFNAEIQQNKKMTRLLDRAAKEANRGRYRQSSTLR